MTATPPDPDRPPSDASRPADADGTQAGRPAARRPSFEAQQAAFLAECRALGLDPEKETITPMMYALAVISPRTPAKKIKPQD